MSRLRQPCPLTYKNVRLTNINLVKTAAVAHCERPITLHLKHSTQVRAVHKEKRTLC